MKKETLIVLAVVFAVLFLGTAVFVAVRESGPRALLPQPDRISGRVDTGEVSRFKNEQEFKEYLSKSQGRSGLLGGFGVGGARGVVDTLEMSAPMAADSAEGMGGFKSTNQRVSETNVQVVGIDEPDIVKTDGKELYVSREGWGYWGEPIPMEKTIETGLRPEPVPMTEDSAGGVSAQMEIMPCDGDGCFVPPRRREPSAETVLVRATPSSDMKEDGSLEKNGNLLLSGQTLVVLSDMDRKIYAYDVSDPAKPEEKWKADWKENSYLSGARLKDGKLYVISQTGVNYSRPCPIEPLVIGIETISVRCEDVYYPSNPAPAETTFTVMRINVADGKMERSVSFLGSYGSVIYMSKDAVYVTYDQPGDFLGFMVRFFRENAGVIPAEVVSRLEKVAGYDISDSAKMTEFSTILERHLGSLTNDERMKMENEMENKMADFAKKHRRELEGTGLARIDAEKLEVTASGLVPGRPLNQFSLDEYEGNLRIATTVGGGWLGMMGTRSESVNDVYILDKNLKIRGKIEDLGVGERIYSARFIGDKGYLVTFKQIDPFFVLDLSDPDDPQKKGELKIPGFSSYLHPISETRILGVGQENGQVKLSLFDVSSAENPTEIAKYNLDDYWSEVSSNHHAFLLDPDHEIFFLPGGNGGYVFSYAGDKLELKKAISDVIAKRAVYIGNDLYVIGQDKIRVFNENSWEEVGKLEF